MQSSESEKKSRCDEDSINFRPSPNFKHMRKYLKSKFEEANQNMSSQLASQLASQMASQMTSPDNSNGMPEVSERNDKQAKLNKSNAVVQPPLPPNPPPPESPPIMNLKQEIEDDEYGTTENNVDFNQSEKLTPEMIKTDTSEVVDKPEVTMCRNFARGTCKKGAACIFAHELILSQLPGVYTFCRNFQNSVCTFPKCKFVHATVFEKEHFFRTGYLPPYTLAHLKENNALQPPPPPPPKVSETATTVPQFANSLPLQTGPCIAPVVNCAAAPSIDGEDPNLFHAAVLTGSPKREWSDTDSDFFSSSPCDIDSSEPLAKKCKRCDKNEYRLQYHKNMLERVMRSTVEMNNKYEALNKKSLKLSSVLVSLARGGKTYPRNSMDERTSNGLNGEDKTLLDTVTRYLYATTNIFPQHNGDENHRFPGLMSANVSGILTKLLLNNGNPAVPPDSS